MLGYFHGCGHILPAEFTQEISEYEILCKVLKEISELDLKLNTVSGNAKQYTDSKFNIAMENINNLEEYVNDQISRTQKYVDREVTNSAQHTLNESKSYTDEIVVNLRKYLMSMINILKVTIAQSLVDLENKVKELNEAQRLWVLSEINKMWVKIEGISKNLIVKNPLTGQLDDLQSVINQIWSLTNQGGITCGEYDSLGLTCEEYDNKNITCYQYDTQARERLLKDYRFIMYQPVSGKEVNYKQVISWLTSLHQTECLTCEDYDSKELTCTDYDNLELSCEQYDWHSETLINVSRETL